MTVFVKVFLTFKLIKLMKSTLNTSPAALLIAIAFFASPLQAEQTSPYQLQNGADIKLTGEVTKAGAHSFKLNYGKGSILIEVDDYDSYEEGYNVEVGDQVVVWGKVDADHGEERTIEAGEVYIPSVDLRIEVCSDDEEDPRDRAIAQRLSNGTKVELQGVIKNIKSEVCTIQCSKGNLEIRLSSLGKHQRKNLLLGQAIKVSGVYKNRLLRNDMIVAHNVVTTTRQP